MTPSVLLRLLLLVPFLGAIVVASLGPRRGAAVRWLSLGVTLLNLAIAVAVAASYVGANRSALGDASLTFQPLFTTVADLLPLGPGSIQFFIGLDGLNLWLIVLTTLLMVPAVLVSWQFVQHPGANQRILRHGCWPWKRP